jgi:hypothetical protein
MHKNHQSSKVTISGIFLKREISPNSQTYYHFILPEIYHGKLDEPSHTTRVLTEFDNKVVETNEKKIDGIIKKIFK